MSGMSMSAAYLGVAASGKLGAVSQRCRQCRSIGDAVLDLAEAPDFSARDRAGAGTIFQRRTADCRSNARFACWPAPGRLALDGRPALRPHGHLDGPA